MRRKVFNGQPAAWKGNLIAFIASVVLGLGAIEGFSRLLDSGPAGLEALNMRPRPYMMFVGPNIRDPVWRNVETGTDVPSRMAFNNLGFTNESDFSFPPDEAFIREFQRKPGERLILITGGSAVHGVGATANDRTIAGQIEAVLNQRQSRHRYRVLNLAMGGWIAYQQFVGLTLFGRPLDPDWIVVMDGHNDATTTCSHGSGPGNPMEWPKLLYLIGGGQGLGASPWMQWLLRNMAAARVLTGLRPERQSSESDRLYFDRQDADRRFEIKLRGVTFGDLDRQIAFYLQSQRNVEELFSRANVLFATQPLLHRNPVSPWYRKAYRPAAAPSEIAGARRRLEADLDTYMAKAAAKPCGRLEGVHPLGYFMPRSALNLERKVADWASASADRRIFYANVETLFPDRYDLRLPFFVDNVHMSDLGQRRVAERFAGQILQADLGIGFDAAALAAAVQADAIDMLRRRTAAGPKRPPGRPPEPPGRPVTAHYDAIGVTVTEVATGLLQIAEHHGNGVHRVLWKDVASRAGQSTLAVDVWFDTAVDMVRLEIRDASGTHGRADFDLAAKSVAAAGAAAGAHVEDLGRGWRRLTLTVPLATGDASLGVALLSPDDEAAASYAGEGRSLIIALPVLETTSGKM